MTGRPLPRIREDLEGFGSYQTQQQPADVRLHANEWADPTPLSRYLDPEDLDATHLNRYPDQGGRALRERLAAELGVTADQLVLGNGSNEVLLYTFLVFGGHGRRLLIFTPTYSMYGRFARTLSMEIASEHVGLPYDLDARRMRDAIARHRPDLICLCSPNNPTGTLLAREVVLAASDAAPRACVLVDEAYADFARASVIPEIADRPNLVVARTFSKARAAAGLRLGIIVADARVVATYDAVRLPYNLSALTQRVAIRVLDDPSSVAGRVEVAARERERMLAALRRHAELAVEPSWTNFIFIGLRTRGPADVHRALLERGVLVRDVSGWPGAGKALRVTVGTPAENDRFLTAMSEILRDGEGS